MNRVIQMVLDGCPSDISKQNQIFAETYMRRHPEILEGVGTESNNAAYTDAFSRPFIFLEVVYSQVSSPQFRRETESQSQKDG